MNSEQRTKARKELQGPRPAPLKIRKNSHTIRKQTSQPVIIYTQSPKIIHIEPHNFMNLVQRLTGSTSSSADDNMTVARDDLYPAKIQARDHEDLGNNTAMASTDESGIACHERREIGEGKLDHPVKGFVPFSPGLNFLSPSSLLRMSPSIFQDMPLFTPGFENFMYSPGQFLRLAEAIFTPKNED